MEVRLPAAAAVAVRAPVPPSTPATRRLRVAIIDDDVLLARSFAALVATEHEVETFTAPRAALAALADGAVFDRVLCDVNMPGLSGPDLYVELCARRPEYAARFTMVTGGLLTPRLEALLATGAVRLLRKPFDMAALMAELDAP
jgi:DNA-binding NtrC family response regulator